LVPALEWHSREIGKRAEINVEFTSSLEDLKIPTDTATGIFRIYQEALTNAIRHANAGEICSSLEFSGGFLKMIVSDNGKGMDLSVSSSGKTLGLLGIKERTHILGGNFEYKSEPGKGTELLIMVPYFRDEQNNPSC
jgi:signal transduction histidine kinase